MESETLKNRRKVIIVGGGPAGISTALNLSTLGVDDILVIEKYRFPRYKCCAGYITNKTKAAYEKLGLDIEGCNYSLIKDFNIFYKNKKRLNITNKFLYTNRKIDRVELDDRFFALAKSKGIDTVEGASVVSHDFGENKIVLSNGSEYYYDNLVFADGTAGFGSRYQKPKRRNIALQMTFESDRSESIDIHFGVTKRGYAWVSSYGGVTNVGMTDVFTEKRNYKKIFSDFLKAQGFDVGTENLTSAMTPMYAGTPVIYGNVYFVGDAVGACDPLTLSGIRYGLATGGECAKAIAHANMKPYKKHVGKLKRKFGFMRFMQKVFYLKGVLGLTFNVLCRFFGKLVSVVFNNFFVGKK